MKVPTPRNGTSLARFFKFVDTSGDCWLWTGWVAANGYGRFYVEGHRRQAAHRWLYEQVYGPVGNLHIDHLCRVRTCVRPEHLDAVTPRVNVLRALQYRKVTTECVNGHTYDAETQS